MIRIETFGDKRSFAELCLEVCYADKATSMVSTRMAAIGKSAALEPLRLSSVSWKNRGRRHRSLSIMRFFKRSFTFFSQKPIDHKQAQKA